MCFNLGSFAEAELVFFDPLAIHDVDPDARGEISH
jgi:hypothetical protein